MAIVTPFRLLVSGLVLCVNFAAMKILQTNWWQMKMMLIPSTFKDSVAVVSWKEDIAEIAKEQIRYRYPSQSFMNNASAEADLVAMVLSTTDKKHRRDLIRSTWGNGTTGSSVFFVLAGNWTPSLHEEWKQWQDLIWIDHSDTYRNLTIKVYAGFTAIYHHHAAFLNPAAIMNKTVQIFKTDDDIYLDPLRLRRVIASNASGEAISGHCWSGTKVIRDTANKWHVPHEEYPNEEFPCYCSGTGYAVTPRFLACAIPTLAKGETFVRNEDTQAGILVEKCHLPKPVSIPKFSSLDVRTPTLAAKNAYIVQHLSDTAKSEEALFSQMHEFDNLNNPSPCGSDCQLGRVVQVVESTPLGSPSTNSSLS